jgi:hypothetical protein
MEPEVACVLDLKGSRYTTAGPVVAKYSCHVASADFFEEVARHTAKTVDFEL